MDLPVAMKLGKTLLHAQAQNTVQQIFLKKSRYGLKTSESAVLSCLVGFGEA